MGNKVSQNSKDKKPAVIITRVMEPRVTKTASLPSIPLSVGAVSLTCLAAEHHQIHDSTTLDAWRTKALETVNDLYNRKAMDLRNEAHMSELVGQLRAMVNDDTPRAGTKLSLDDQPAPLVQNNANA